MATPGMDRVPSAMRNLLGNTKGMIQVLTSVPIRCKLQNQCFWMQDVWEENIMWTPWLCEQDLDSSVLLTKIVAEDLEKANDAESVRHTFICLNENSTSPSSFNFRNYFVICLILFHNSWNIASKSALHMLTTGSVCNFISSLKPSLRNGTCSDI